MTLCRYRRRSPGSRPDRSRVRGGLRRRTGVVGMYAHALALSYVRTYSHAYSLAPEFFCHRPAARVTCSLCYKSLTNGAAVVTYEITHGTSSDSRTDGREAGRSHPGRSVMKMMMLARSNAATAPPIFPSRRQSKKIWGERKLCSTLFFERGGRNAR